MYDIFFNSSTYKQLDPKFTETPVPACESFEYMSQAYLECYIRENTISYMHPTSSCRMGPNSTVAVVDSKLRLVHICP